jgi:hypothetical protein
MSETQEVKNDPVPLMLRLPPALHAKIKKLAETDRRSLNTMVILLLESKIAELEQPSTTTTLDPLTVTATGTVGKPSE